MSNVELSKKINSNKRILNAITKLMNVCKSNNYLKVPLTQKKEHLENLINSQNELLGYELMNNCNHIFALIKSNEERKVMCVKCGLTNMFEEIGIYGDSKEAKMNRNFLNLINNIDSINISLELGIFANPYYAKNLYLRAIEVLNIKSNEEIIKKMLELKRKDQGKTKVLK